MKLTLNGVSYDVPRMLEEKLMGDLLEEARQDYYAKINVKWRVAAKPFTRGLLMLIEKEAIKAGGIEAGRAVRPPTRDTDSNLWLAGLLAHMLLEGLKQLELTIDEAEGIISAFHLDIKGQNQTGGQVGVDRNVRVRQNDGAALP